MHNEDEDPKQWVVTPRLIGMSIPRADGVAAGRRLHMVQQDPDGPPPLSLTADLGIDATVVTQQPPFATVLREGSSVVVTWQDNTSGVREPRRPKPDFLAMHHPLGPDAD